MQWRDLVQAFGPRWLSVDIVRLQDGTEVELPARVPYALLTLLDFYRDRIRFGIRARMTSQAPADALGYIGQNLKTFQGPSESIASYRARLKTAIDDLRLAGTALPLLTQIRGYCSPYPVRVRIVNERGHFYTLETDGSFTRYRYSNWNWDNGRADALQLGLTRTRADGSTGALVPWSKYWVIIYPTAAGKPWTRDGTWGDGSTWGNNGQTWGSTATPDDVFAIRRIVRTFRPLGSRCVSIVVCFSDVDAAVDPFAPGGSSPPLPDGKWKWASKYDRATPGQRVIARNRNSIYWPGTVLEAPL